MRYTFQTFRSGKVTLALENNLTKMAYTNAFTAENRAGDNNQASHWHVTFNNPIPQLHYVLSNVIDPDAATEPRAEGIEDESDYGQTQIIDVPVVKTKKNLEILLVLPGKDEQKDLWKEPILVDWFVGQLEEGEECHTPHIHLHVKLSRPASFTMFQRLISMSAWQGAHLAKVKMIKEHLAYVTKEKTRVAGPFRSDGAPDDGDAIKGKRKDLDMFKNALDNATVKEVWNDHFPNMLRYYKAAEAYKLATKEAPERPLHEVIVLFGRPGTGKSALARELLLEFFPDSHPFCKSVGKWFDGYMGERGVLMDDYDGLGQCVRDIKNILDKTVCRVEVKGGTVALAQEVTIITTNTLPSQWFANPDSTGRRPVTAWDVDAVLRRCHFFLCDTDMFDRVPGGIQRNAAGNAMGELIHKELQKTRNGQLSEYKGKEGEAKLHAAFQILPDNNNNPALYPVQTPRSQGQNALQALVKMRAATPILVVSDSEEDDEDIEIIASPIKKFKRSPSDEIWVDTPK